MPIKFFKVIFSLKQINPSMDDVTMIPIQTTGNTIVLLIPLRALMKVNREKKLGIENNIPQ